MKKETIWGNIFVIVLSVSLISYVLERPEFPWNSNPLFPSIVPIIIFLTGWGICELYTKVLSPKITPKNYRFIFSILIMAIGLVAAYPFRMSGAYGSIFAVGGFLTMYSNFLFSLFVDIRSSSIVTKEESTQSQ